MARQYVTRRGPAAELARVWDQLPAARQMTILNEIRSALRVVRDDTWAEASDLAHGPYGSAEQPLTHNHAHHAAGDRTHAHQHAHAGDAVHVGHDHSALERAQQSADRVRRQSQAARAGRPRVLNSARCPDDPWDALAEMAEQIKR